MSLQSAKLPDLHIYAIALRVPLKVGNKHNKKETLLADIIAKFHDSGRLLAEDWMRRVDSGRNPWRINFDPVRKYFLAELQDLASKMGISVLHKTIAELRHVLLEKSNMYSKNEEKYEEEEK